MTPEDFIDWLKANNYVVCEKIRPVGFIGDEFVKLEPVNEEDFEYMLGMEYSNCTE